MTIADASAAAKILSGVKLNRIPDKEAKSALLKDYLALRRVARDANADKDEIVRKFQEDWGDELAAVESFRRQGKAVVGHLDYLEAERDANKAISDIFTAEVEVEISPAKMDAVADLSDEVTFEQLAFLAECGIVEE